jgi:hypothetical protein
MCAAQTNRSETGNASACDHESKQGQPFRLALCLSRCKSTSLYMFDADVASAVLRSRRRHRTSALHPHHIPEVIPLRPEVGGGAIDRF